MTITIRWRTARKIWRELAGKKPSPQTRHISINGHDVVEVVFTEEQASLVIQKAELVPKTELGLINRLNGPLNRWKLGFLGQVAFFIYAEDDFPKGLNSLCIGKRDEFDCILKGYKIDIKTRAATRDLLMVPEWQFPIQHHDFYVGARIQSQNPYVIQIWGYATRKELENVKPSDEWGHGSTRAIPFENLHPMIELRDLLTKKPLQSFF
jgi:hypothetical protein